MAAVIMPFSCSSFACAKVWNAFILLPHHTCVIGFSLPCRRHFLFRTTHNVWHLNCCCSIHLYRRQLYTICVYAWMAVFLLLQTFFLVQNMMNVRSFNNYEHCRGSSPRPAVFWDHRGVKPYLAGRLIRDVVRNCNPSRILRKTLSLW